MGRWILFMLACAAVVIGAVLLWSTAARAQSTPCWPIAVFEREISDVGETMVAVGQAGAEQVRFYVNQSTRLWTVVRITPDGHACLVAMGSNLDFARPPPAGRAS